MITVLVQFRLPNRVTPAEAARIFSLSAPSYREVEGLVRKYYVLSDDRQTAGGVYLWKTREAAERMYNADWRQTVAERYGAEPEVTWFETPVIVDNEAGRIVSEA